jgi:hypothetical protein
VLKARVSILSVTIVAFAVLALAIFAAKPRVADQTKPSANLLASSQQGIPLKQSLPTPQAKLDPIKGFPALTTLLAAKTASDAKAAWMAARQELLSHPNGSQALSAILSALEGGADLQLESRFKVGANGELLEAPSLRVYLLDLLAQIDNKEAARYARLLLDQSASSDEWAIAMRNYAWGTDNASSDPFLRSKTQELISNQTWINNPTAGFLEAFDFVPYTGDPDLIAPLADLTHRDPQDPVRRAAFLALARFITDDSSAGLKAVARAEQQQLFSPLRADTMARADFTKADDIEIVRQYLLNQAIDPQEYAIFANSFPHGGQFAGATIATSFKPLSIPELAKRDAQALKIFGAWLQDPVFEPRRAELLRIHNKLERLNQSAVAGGYLN